MIFSRTRSSSDPDDISLTVCRFLIGAWGGSVTYGNPNTIGQNPPQNFGMTASEVCFPDNCNTGV